MLALQDENHPSIQPKLVNPPKKRGEQKNKQQKIDRKEVK
jgi:hypothetical protein